MPVRALSYSLLNPSSQQYHLDQSFLGFLHFINISTYGFKPEIKIPLTK